MGRADGSYPVWIGRTRGGPVACYLVDMLMRAPDVPVPGPYSSAHDPSSSPAGYPHLGSTAPTGPATVTLRSARSAADPDVLTMVASLVVTPAPS
jgi:hypothetical protein